jgi:hypothetical protein
MGYYGTGRMAGVAKNDSARVTEDYLVSKLVNYRLGWGQHVA